MTAAHGYLIFLCLIWGLTFPLVQIALEDASPFAFLAVRFAIAVLIFPAFAWKRVFRLNGDLLRKGLGLGLLLFGGFAFQTFGLAHTTADRAAFITGLFVPFTPLFAWLLFRERIVGRLWIAVTLAFIGLVTMSWPESGGALNIGDVFVFCCAVIFALQVVMVDRWVNHDNEDQLTWLGFLFTLVAALLFLPFVPVHFNPTAPLIWILLYCAIPGLAFAIWMQLRYQPKISSTAAAVIYATEPIFASLAAWAIQDHFPQTRTLVGAVFIVAAMLLSVPVKKVIANATEAFASARK